MGVGLLFRVIFFGLYTFIVWFLCAGYRRMWRGLGVLILSLAGLWGLKSLLSLLAEGGKSVVLDAVVVPYAALLVLGGGYILVLPRRHQSWACAGCGYDLRGHEDERPTCPECGRGAALKSPNGQMVKLPNEEAVGVGRAQV